MTGATWHQRLDLAHSPQAVVEIARDFVAGFSPYELHALPVQCRPSTKLFVEDIGQLAFELVQHGCATANTAETVHRLASFFARASARLAQLAMYDRAGARTAIEGSRSSAA